MWTFLILSVLSVLLSGTAVVWSELQGSRQAERDLRSGNWRAAFDGYMRLIQSEPVFLDHNWLEAGKEEAAIHGLRTAIAARDYREAVFLIATVQRGKETSFELEAQATASTLPGRHFQWVEQLLQEGQLARALQEVRLVAELYADPQVSAQARAFEAQILLTQARYLARQGDEQSLSGLIELVASLETSEAPFPVRIEATNLALQAITRIAERLWGAGDYAALYRYLAYARKLPLTPHLQHQLESLCTKYSLRLFGTHASLEEVEELPLTDIEPSKAHDKAVLAIRNATSRSLMVRLRGPEEHTLIINRGTERQIRLRPGEYVQLVHRGARPQLGIIQVDSRIYHQIFDDQSSKG